MLAARTEVGGSNEVLRGIHAGLSIAIGYIPVALTYGLLAKSTGLSFLEAISMSIFLYAGAAQFITLNLIALGTGALEIVLTIFMVNIRHLLMSAAIGERAEKSPKLLKAIYSFFITDETFSIAATREEKLTAKFMFGIGLTAYSSWVICSGIGYLIGAGLPQVLQESMSIALYAMFIGLLVPSIKRSKKYLILAGFAAVLNTILMQIPNMSVGWSIIIATICASVTVEIVATRGESSDD